ncbi:MAG: NINE protein [Pseudolysinimonas sp.]
MTNAAPPGWYSDPSNPATEHWWDGTAYLHSRPKGPPLPPAPVYSPQAYAVGATGGRVSPKSRTVASILGFFLGVLGVDRFYLGNIGMGIAKLLVGWLTAGIWPLIDWIIILAGSAHDGEGLPVKNWS